MGGRHGRHLVTAGTVFVASTWQQIYQVIFVKPPKKNVMDVMVFVWENPMQCGGISHPCGVQPHRLARGRSSIQFLVQFVIEKKQLLRML